MSTVTSSPATRAIAYLIEQLEEFGVTATDDPGAFYPQPVGVLVGLPTLIRRQLSSSAFEIPVLIVSGDPLNSALVRDRLYLLADEVARALKTNNYRPSSWRSSVNAEPLPALELTVTTSEEDSSP